MRRTIGIIAHVDHGKSTLADRLMEAAGVVDARTARPQLLDVMELERERGITIKMQPVELPWRHPDTGDPVLITLIDTPGHVDFAYEVSRALAAVEGVVLLVDATQGVQAQTLAVLEKARDAQLTIIPALSKVDLPGALIDEGRLMLADLLGIDPEEVLLTSGKTGIGVPALLDEVVRRVPPPSATLERIGREGGVRALVFDFQYSEHQGVILHVRTIEGDVRVGERYALCEGRATFVATEVGGFRPEREARQFLPEGAIGYVVTGIKEPGIAHIGDTLTLARHPAAPLPGFQLPQPLMWASVYPEGNDEFPRLRRAVERVRLSDSSLTFEEETSAILGRGLRLGCLGMLHLDIILERLRREFGLSLIVAQPSLAYRVRLKSGEERVVRTAAAFPQHGEVEEVWEPWVEAQVITPPQWLEALMPLWHEYEGEVGDVVPLGDGRVRVIVSLPLRELMRGLHDRIKSASAGYASLSYRLAGERRGNLTRLDVLLAEEEVPALARIIPRHRAGEEARALVTRLKEVLPRQLFVLKIQARVDGRIIAAERLPALRKDVTGHLYGGDVTRKRKLLEKQKEGKRRLLTRARVRVPPEVFAQLLRRED